MFGFGAGTRGTACASGEFGSLDDIRHTPLGGGSAAAGNPASVGPASLSMGNTAAAAARPAAPLLVQDVATVTFGPRAREEITHVNGQESIGLILTRSPDANTVAVAASLRRALDDLQPQETGAPRSGRADIWQLANGTRVGTVGATAGQTACAHPFPKR